MLLTQEIDQFTYPSSTVTVLRILKAKAGGVANAAIGVWGVRGKSVCSIFAQSRDAGSVVLDAAGAAWLLCAAAAAAARLCSDWLCLSVPCCSAATLCPPPALHWLITRAAVPTSKNIIM